MLALINPLMARKSLPATFVHFSLLQSFTTYLNTIGPVSGGGAVHITVTEVFFSGFM